MENKTGETGWQLSPMFHQEASIFGLDKDTAIGGWACAGLSPGIYPSLRLTKAFRLEVVAVVVVFIQSCWRAGATQSISDSYLIDNVRSDDCIVTTCTLMPTLLPLP